MGLGLTFSWTDLSTRKIDWFMGLQLKSKCDVSTWKLNSDTSGNSLSILSTSFRISSQMLLSFSSTNCWYRSWTFSFKSESLPTDIWKKKTSHVGCTDKQSQNVHFLLIWDFERHKLLQKWSKTRNFMPLKYGKKRTIKAEQNWPLLACKSKNRHRLLYCACANEGKSRNNKIVICS